MKLQRNIIKSIAISGFISLLLSAALISYLFSQNSYPRQSLYMRMADFGFTHPIPPDTRWHIADHPEAIYPLTIVGYEPQLFLCSIEEGGYDIYFYANAEQEGKHYDISVREISSQIPVEFSMDGKLLEKRPLSSAEARWSPDSSRLPLQKADPIRILHGDEFSPYVIQAIITERDSGKHVASANYLVKGNRLKK